MRKDNFTLATLFAGYSLAVTLVSLPLSSSDFKIGVLRPLSAIPLHEFVLVLSAIVVGVFASLSYRRLALDLASLSIAVVVLLDIDHLPSFFNIPQPIRPAHSIIVFLLFVAIIYMLGFSADKIAVASSAFVMHSAIDAGVFPVFWPLVPAYYSLDSVRYYLLSLSLFLALASGFAKRRLEQSSVAVKSRNMATEEHTRMKG